VVGRARLPTLARLPAVAAQKVGGGGEHIRHTVLQISASVPVEIDSILEVTRRQELRMSDLAGPTATHFSRCQIAALYDAQRVKQVRGEELGAAAVEGERGERANDGKFAAAVRAVVCLEPPDRDQNRPRHTEALLDAIEGRLVRAHEALAPADQRRVYAACIELLKAQFEGALGAV